MLQLFLSYEVCSTSIFIIHCKIEFEIVLRENYFYFKYICMQGKFSPLWHFYNPQHQNIPNRSQVKPYALFGKNCLGSFGLLAISFSLFLYPINSKISLPSIHKLIHFYSDKFVKSTKFIHNSGWKMLNPRLNEKKIWAVDSVRPSRLRK